MEATEAVFARLRDTLPLIRHFWNTEFAEKAPSYGFRMEIENNWPEDRTRNFDIVVYTKHQTVRHKVWLMGQVDILEESLGRELTEAMYRHTNPIG